jgi:hypothetical protein
MTDIFISYAREDQARIQPLAHALENEGWSVFWDRRIPAGQTWRTYIGKALSEASCVLVAWSRQSIISDWVSEEADEGKQRGILVPVLLDSIQPPIGFREIQAADLINWQSEHPSPDFDQLLRDIKGILLGTSVAAPTKPLGKPKPSRTKHQESKPTSRPLTYALLILGLFLVAGSGYWVYQRQQESSDSFDLPRPNIIILGGTEEYEANGRQWKRYQLVVTNWASYPVELFEPAPDLAPCGLNNDSSRTWVDIFDALKKRRIYGFCALTSPEDLNGIWFSVEQRESPPRTVYVKLKDRRKGMTYISDTIELK